MSCGCDANVFTVPVPGPMGIPGAPGATGSNGHSAFTVSTAAFLMPAEGANVAVEVQDATAFAVGEIFYVYSPPAVGYFELMAVTDTQHITLKNLKNTAAGTYAINSAPGTNFIVGAILTPTGLQGPAGAAAGGAAPATATYITQTPDATLSSEQALSLLATGILKSTTATGVVSTAVNGTDYYGPATPTDVPVTDGGTGSSTAAGARTNLGLVIGANVQAQDAGLQSLSALPTVADRIAYSTALDTWAETTITLFGRNLIATADAAAARTLLGVSSTLGLLAYSTGINANSATTDTALTMLAGNYIIEQVIVTNASISLTTATAGLFTAAGGAGTTLCSDQALTPLTATTKWMELSQQLVVGTDRFTAGTLYFRIGTAQGAAATLDVYIYGRVIP